MKKILLTVSLTILTWMVFAQGEIVTKYFNEFANDDRYTKVSVSSKMFSLFTELESGSPEEAEFLKAVSKLKGMKMIVGDSVPNGMKSYNQAVKEVDAGGFEELMSVIDKNKNLNQNK